MKNVNITVTEHDGMDTRCFVLRLGIDEAALEPNKDSIREAVIKACTEYVQTEEGKKTYEYNCGCFNWADFESEVPNSICEKYGFAKRNSSDESFEVDWDEHLVDDAELDDAES